MEGLAGAWATSFLVPSRDGKKRDPYNEAGACDGWEVT